MATYPFSWHSFLFIRPIILARPSEAYKSGYWQLSREHQVCFLCVLFLSLLGEINILTQFFAFVFLR
jgi:hypothetical protein